MSNNIIFIWNMYLMNLYIFWIYKTKDLIYEFKKNIYETLSPISDTKIDENEAKKA